MGDVRRTNVGGMLRNLLRLYLIALSLSLSVQFKFGWEQNEITLAVEEQQQVRFFQRDRTNITQKDRHRRDTTIWLDSSRSEYYRRLIRMMMIEIEARQIVVVVAGSGPQPAFVKPVRQICSLVRKTICSNGAFAPVATRSRSTAAAASSSRATRSHTTTFTRTRATASRSESTMPPTCSCATTSSRTTGAIRSETSTREKDLPTSAWTPLRSNHTRLGIRNEIQTIFKILKFANQTTFWCCFYIFAWVFFCRFN